MENLSTTEIVFAVTNDADIVELSMEEFYNSSDRYQGAYATRQGAEQLADNLRNLDEEEADRYRQYRDRLYRD